MQVRPGGPAGHADVADLLALVDVLAAPDADLAQVRVDGHAAVGVLHLDHVAVAVLLAGERHDAVADDVDGGADGCAVVDALVALPFLEDRVEAHREARGDARERERAGQEGAVLAAAVEVEVRALAAGIGEPHRRIRMAGVDELGGQHAAGALVPRHRLAVGGERLVDHAEGVAPAQFAMEVDVGGEHVGHLRGDRIGHVGVVRRREQRRADGAAGQARGGAHGHLFDLAGESVFAAGDGQAREVGGELVVALGGVAHDELGQLAGVVGGGGDQLAGAALPQLARGGVDLQEGVELVVGQPQALGERAGGVVGARDLAAREHQVLRGERVELGVDVLGRERLGDEALGQGGRVGGHRRQAEGRAGQGAQHREGARGEAARVGVGPVRDAA